MTIPAGRYKVEERDRRLVTIDTLTGQEIGGIGRAPSTKDALEAPRPTAFPKEVARAAAPARSASTASNMSPSLSGSADWATTLAGLSPGAQVQSSGTIWLSTKPWYDDAGERTVQLSEQGKGRLANLMGALFALTLCIILFAIWGDIFFTMAFIFVILRAGKTVLKPVYRSIITDAATV
jgi:hypothetical protein